MLSNGAPGKIRTPDPQIRSLVLYPAELPVRTAQSRCRAGGLTSTGGQMQALFSPRKGGTPEGGPRLQNDGQGDDRARE